MIAARTPFPERPGPDPRAAGVPHPDRRGRGAQDPAGWLHRGRTGHLGQPPCIAELVKASASPGSRNRVELQLACWAKGAKLTFKKTLDLLATWTTANRPELSAENARAKAESIVQSVYGNAFDGPEAFFEPTMLTYVERTWENWLGPLVADLPPFDLVIGELRPQIEILVV